MALVQEENGGAPSSRRLKAASHGRIRTKVMHIADLMAEQPSLPVVKLGGARSYFAVPMLKENELVGVIVIYRQEVRPFTDKQVELVESLPTRPSSPSRTRGCSASYANLYSSRPQPRTCSRSSAARRLICRLCCKPSLNQLLGSVMPISATITREKDGAFYRAEAYGFSREFMDFVRKISQSRLNAVRHPGARCSKAGLYISPT